MKRLASLIFLVLISTIAGCASNNLHAQPSDRAPAQVGIVNHTGNYIYSASVDGAGGGGMDRWGAGVANICCASIPRVWQPGMKVLVRWNMPVGIQDVIKEKVVEVEKYDRPGSIYIHFFPDDEVRVIVTSIVPYNSAHPIPYAGNPNEK
ncbi:DUF3304 domain-containing protein [Duganella sp. CY15W]|uniref:DUF3304 domain-containing protein n=1 Tax=Duganella sp. CY15W TaxID=2692172 RepID=UPI00136A2BAA|nr:DUF3304 domain-containing protein [Duganella sp. CY15W]MYM27039.1 DUF3304 domain-containing protein [Duganella sp. CY15W]